MSAQPAPRHLALVRPTRRLAAVPGVIPSAPMGDAYLDFLRLGGKSEATIISRRRLFRRVEAATGSSLLDVDEAAMIAWDRARSLVVEDDTRAGELASLRAFYRWAILFGLRDDNPLARIQSPKKKHRVPRPIAEDRLALAIRTAEPTRVRPMLVLAAFAGLRAMEIAQARAEDVQAGRLVVTGKGGRTRVVPIHPIVRGELALLPQAGWLFPKRDGTSGHVQAWQVSHRCNAHLHEVGVPDTLHSLRHRFGTAIYASSLDLRVTQELLGHTSPMTTQLYAAWSPGSASAAVEALPSLAG